MKSRVHIPALIALIASGPALASGTQQSGSATATGKSTSNSRPKMAVVDPLSTTVQLQSSTTADQSNVESRSSSLSLLLTPKYRLTQELSVSGELMGSKELAGEQKFTLADAVLTGRHLSPEFLPGTRFTPGISLQLPTSEKSRNDYNMYAGLGVLPRVSANFAKIWDDPNLDMSYQMGFYRLFHAYDRSESGSPLSEYKLAHRGDVSYQLGRRFRADILFIYTSAWTYQNSQIDTFTSDQSITWIADPRWEITVGHTNEGNALRPDGSTTNISLANSNSSTFYGSLLVRF